MSKKHIIPARYVEFCKAVATLAVNTGLDRMSLTFRPGFGADDWSDQIQANWEMGRHGDEMENLRITSTVTVSAPLVSIDTDMTKEPK